MHRHRCPTDYRHRGGNLLSGLRDFFSVYYDGCLSETRCFPEQGRLRKRGWKFGYLPTARHGDALRPTGFEDEVAEQASVRALIGEALIRALPTACHGDALRPAGFEDEVAEQASIRTLIGEALIRALPTDCHGDALRLTGFEDAVAEQASVKAVLCEVLDRARRAETAETAETAERREARGSVPQRG